MYIRFPLVTINLSTEYDIIYRPATGTIVNLKNHQTIYKLHKKEIKPYFYFKLEFDSYQYKYIYIPGGTKKVVHKKIYHLYLYLNMSNLLLGGNVFNPVRDRLLYYFISMQMKEFIDASSYLVNDEELEHFIKYRESKLMYFIKWNYYRLNSNYVYDFLRKYIIYSKYVNKIYFKRKGGIIETNDIKKIIKEHFSIGNNLVIIPSNMSNLWKNTTIITYDCLLHLKKSGLEKWTNKKYDRIIIHECHVQFLSGIKYLINNLKCDCVWIINSLPLRYYFSNKTTPCKLNMNHLITISNIWLSFDADHKKKYRTELVRLFLTKFKQYYAQIMYKSRSIGKIALQLSPFEKQISESFQHYLSNWINHSTLSLNQSQLVENKVDTMKAQLFQSIFSFESSAMDKKDVSAYFQKKIKYVMDYCNENLHKTQERINSYLSFTGIKMNCILDTFEEKINKIKSVLANYTRYINYDYEDLISKDSSCSVCYEPDNFTPCILICGHIFCTECIINSIAYSNECPICREIITVDKICLVKEKNKLNINKHFNDYGDKTVLLTNFKDFSSNGYRFSVINTNRNNITQQIKYTKNIEKLVLFTSPYLKKQEKIELDQITQYFKLFNNQPKIRSIQIQDWIN